MFFSFSYHFVVFPTIKMISTKATALYPTDNLSYPDHPGPDAWFCQVASGTFSFFFLF